MFCTKCGTELPDDSKFCSKCGKSTVNNSVKKGEPPKVEQKYKKEYIGNFDKNDERKNYEPTYGCGYESSTTFSTKNSWKRTNVKKDFSWQVILETVFTIVIPLIVSIILYKVSAIYNNVFGRIFPSQDGTVSTVTVIGIISLFIISWILWAVGKYIGKRLSNETGLVFGIVLIIIGITLYIGIPIIIYSRGAKQVELV